VEGLVVVIVGRTRASGSWRREDSVGAGSRRGARATGLAAGLAIALLVGTACDRPAAPPVGFTEATRPAASDWSLEPADLLRQPLEPPLLPFSLAIVSGAGVVQEGLAEGFSVPEAAAGVPFVWAVGDRSSVRFPLDRLESLRLDLRARPFQYPGAPPQRLAIEVNGVAAGSIDVPNEASERSLALPAGALRVGWNQLSLVPAWSREPRSVLAGNADARALSVAVEVLRLVRTGPALAYVRLDGAAAEAPAALAQDGSGAVSWLFRVPKEGAALELSWQAPVARAAASVRATLEHDDGDETLWEESVAANGAAGARRLDLAPFAGRAARLRLAVEGLAPPARWLWTGLRLRAADEPAAAAPAAVPAQPGLNVLVVILDAAQRARFGLYGNPRGTTPRIDALAQDSLVFDVVHSAAPYTLASTVSLFTSRFSPQHGVIEKQHRLGTTATTLAGVLRDAGYATGAFSANAFVTERYGLSLGFDTFVELFRNHPGGPIVPAEEFFAPATDWLRARAEDARSGRRPFFLYLHYIQPHEPYDAAPAAFYQGLDPAYDGPVTGSVASMYEIFEGRVRPGPRDLAQLERLYEGNLRYADAAVGRLLDELAAIGLLDRTLVVVTSDHGEALGENGRFGHNTSVDESMTAIPLVVRLPAAFPQRRTGRIGEPISNIDVAPLLVESVGLPAPASFAGRNPLRTVLAGETAPARLLYARTAGAQPEVALWSESWKCTLRPGGRTTAGPPAEADAGDPAARARAVTLDLCRDARRSVEAATSPAHAEEVGNLSREQREALEALGYLRE